MGGLEGQYILQNYYFSMCSEMKVVEKRLVRNIRLFSEDRPSEGGQVAKCMSLPEGM